MHPQIRDRLRFVSVMSLVAYALHVVAICCGIYFHYIANGSTLTPSIERFALDYGGFGFWIPALGFAVAPTAFYLAFVALLSVTFVNNDSWPRFVKLLLYTQGVLPVFSFGIIGTFITIDG